MQEILDLAAKGKRKSAIANVSLVAGKGNILINNQLITNYFQFNPTLIKIIQSPFIISNCQNKYDVLATCKGGGLKGQSEAIKLAISRVLFKILEEKYQKQLKKDGFLTRDPRCKERRKYGLKKARKASQFSKR